MNILLPDPPNDEIDGRYDDLELVRPVDQRALVDDLPVLLVPCDDREDVLAFSRRGELLSERDEDPIFFLEKDDLSDPCCESVFHPLDVGVIE